MQSPDLSFVVPSISRDMRSLYEAHFPFVWRYMSQRGVPQAALDDLVHSVFRIVREHPSRRDPSRPRSVIVCMISRQVLREYKKRNGDVANTEPQFDGDGDGPTRTFSRDAATGMLDAVMDSLTEMQREVFLLCAGEKMTSREVGDALGVAEATVEIRLKSAHQRVEALIVRLRVNSMWEGMSDISPKGLLEAAQSARTPSDRDRERIFAAMLAHSMTSGQAPAPVELVSIVQPLPQARPLPLPRMTQPTQPAPSAPVRDPSLRDPYATMAPPLHPAQSRAHLGWAAAAFVAVAMGTASFFMMSSHKVEATPRADTATMQVGMPEVGAEARTGTVERSVHNASPEAAPVAQEKVQEEEQEQVREEPAEPTAPRATKRHHRRSPRRAAPAPTPSTDDRGARQLFAAERALRSGDPRVALELVREHAARFPNSNLSTERNALRAQILCDLGRTKAARRVVLELEAEHAAQPLLASVDEACMNPN